MIRTATLADLPDLGRMMKAFDQASRVHIGGAFAPIVFEGYCRRLIAHRLGLALVLDHGGGPVGMLLAEAGPSPFRPGIWADERALWVAPESRGLCGLRGLVRAYEGWAKDTGASITGLSAQDERTAAVLRRLGYAPAERKLIKVL